MSDTESEAAVRLAKLPIVERLELLNQVFQILEYDEDGNPGGEWSSDTMQSLGELFNAYGVVFTGLSEEEDDLTGRTLYDDPVNDPGWS